MKNKNGIRILASRPQPATYDGPETLDEGIIDALFELRSVKLPTVIPAGHTINTRVGVPSVPTFKGVRFLGKMTVMEKAKLLLKNFGHAVRKTGVYAR
jgi:hypothetical protein